MTLSNDQQNAADSFLKFMASSDTNEMALLGHSGTGKTYLTKYMIEAVRKKNKLFNLITGDNGRANIHCTATTNKAAAILSTSTKEAATTIHSLLGLKVFNNYREGTTSLQKTRNFQPLKNTLLIIDEASMENQHLLDMVRSSTTDCKVLHVMDPYQLLGVHETECAVERSVEHRAVLKTPQRFGNNIAIPELGEGYRKCIDIIRAIPKELKDKADAENKLLNAGQAIKASNLELYNNIIRNAFPKLEPHGNQIQRVNGDSFRASIITQFRQLGKDPDEARIVAWRNVTVGAYNSFVRNMHTYSDKLLEGELVITNKPIMAGRGSSNIPTDTICKINRIGKSEVINFAGIAGWNAELSNGITIFIPYSQASVKKALSTEAVKARKTKDWTTFFRIQEECTDLRPMYASTVHKSQGSTYNKIYIDLHDIGRNPNPEEVARLLYVATTRPSNEVILYGKLPEKYGG